MRSKTVKIQGDVDIVVTETVNLDGKHCIEMREDHPFHDGVNLWPHEAERLGRTLIKFAEISRKRCRKGA